MTENLNWMHHSLTYSSGQEIPSFYGIRGFSAVFTEERHWTLRIQTTFSHHFSNIHFNTILRYTPRFPSDLVREVFRPKLCIHFSSPPCTLHVPPISYL